VYFHKNWFFFSEGPNSKKTSAPGGAPASLNDPFGAQLAARHTNMMEAGLEMGGSPSTEVMMVPDKMVGLIIGRGGEQITRLQAESGCKIQMAQDSQGMSERQCTLSGPPGAIAQARQSIERIIANEGNGPPRAPGGGGGPGGVGGGGGGGGPSPGGPPMGQGGGQYEMLVPGHKVGLIIGKGGETIKQLQERSGAKIIIIQDSPEAAHEKPLRITGPPEAVEAAKHLVADILNQNDDREMGGFGGRGRGRGGPRGGGRGGGDRGGFMGGRGAPRGGGGGYGGGRGGWSGGGGGGGGGSEYGAEATDYVTIPSNKCGLIIGKGGETIKNINSSSGAHCEVDKSAPPDAREKNFIIRGSPEGVERAKAMIMEKLGMQPSYGGGGGGGGGGGSSYGGTSGGSWGGQYGGAAGYQPDSVSVNPATGQPDYSNQWAEYYRSMGMTREAEAIEQQARVSI
jgi:far upstream element-binding protein